MNNNPINVDFIKDQWEHWRRELDKYLCPISQQIMSDPVIISETGQTYDRQSIEKWLKSNNICPLTGKKLTNKTITPNYFLKTLVHEAITKYIKQIIENVKIWFENDDLNEISLEMMDECLILNDKNSKTLHDELFNLKFDILLLKRDEDSLFNECMNMIETLQNYNLQQVFLIKVENKLSKQNNLQKYYTKMLNILINLFSNNSINILKDTFIKYCKNCYNLNEELVNNTLRVVSDSYAIDFLSILLESNYNKYQLLQKIFTIKTVYNRSNLINLLQQLLKAINLKHLDEKVLKDLSLLSENYSELKEEQKLIYLQLVAVTDEVTYLEKIYNLNLEDKEIEKLLMNKYLQKEMVDKFLILYIKTNPNKLDNSILQLLFIQNNKLRKYETELFQLKEHSLNMQNQINQLMERCNVNNQSSSNTKRKFF